MPLKGALERDHCNANKSIVWDRLKSLARAGRTADVKAAYDAITDQPAVPAALDLAADADLATRSPKKPNKKMLEMAAAAKRKADYAVPAVKNERLVIAEAIAAKLKLSMKLPSHLEILPDPALDPRAFELGKISKAVKVKNEGCLSSFVCR